MSSDERVEPKNQPTGGTADSQWWRVWRRWIGRVTVCVLLAIAVTVWWFSDPASAYVPPFFLLIAAPLGIVGVLGWLTGWIYVMRRSDGAGSRTRVVSVALSIPLLAGMCLLYAPLRLYQRLPDGSWRAWSSDLGRVRRTWIWNADYRVQGGVEFAELLAWDVAWWQPLAVIVIGGGLLTWRVRRERRRRAQAGT